MKTKRHRKIMELIKENSIGTQEELAEKLKEAGFAVTQATVSRDIKELALIKISVGKDSYRYGLPTEVTMSESKLRFMLKEFVLNYAVSENILVIRTAPGHANAVAVSLDNAQWEEILGSIAGDDTIFILARKREEIPTLLERLESYLD
ncbi:MAG: arginine repressor [Peptococcaceae bacterium]|nr:arginine repressor [Peptococcaceae bacterium]